MKSRTQTPQPQMLPPTLIGLGIFTVALFPRLVGLQTLVTLDEVTWVRQAVTFWKALLSGAWAETLISGEPAVVTMGTGGLGWWVYTLFQPGFSLADLLATMPLGRVNPFLLSVARLPGLIFSCIALSLIYGLLRPAVGPWTALLAALLLALEPVLLAYTRLLNPEAQMTLLLVPALLLLLRIARGDERGLIWAGIFAGLAWATHWAGLILLPFAIGLFLLVAWFGQETAPRQYLRRTSERLAFWGILAFVVWLLVWPAAWVNPLGAPQKVITSALATFSLPVSLEPIFDLGWLHYPLHFVFYTTPIVMVGLIFWLCYRQALEPEARYTTQALALFALVYLIFRSFFERQNAGAILPVFVCATIVAAVGWSAWLARRGEQVRRMAIAVLLVGQALLALPAAPYYLSYLNPLAGGPWTAPKLIEIGQGEGMNQVGAWLNGQDGALPGLVGADYGPTLAPYFGGQITAVTAPDLAYVVLYHASRQRELPSPTVLRYYQYLLEPAHILRLGGLDYAYIYPGPAVQFPLSLPPAFEANVLPKPLAFRPQANTMPIGGSFTVDVIWLADPAMPETFSVLSLRDPINLDVVVERALEEATGETNSPSHLHETEPPPLTTTIFAEAEAPLLRQAEGLVVSRHTLRVPDDLPEGLYSLLVDGRPLGHIQAAR